MAIPKLYTWKESGNSYKVRLLASFLNVPIDEVETDWETGEHRSPEFLAINPRGTLPTLVHGKHVFRDSAAILIYLAGTNPDAGSDTLPSSWWSADVIEQAKIVDWLAITASLVQFGVARARTISAFLMPDRNSETDALKAQLVEAKARGHKALEILQETLEKEKWLALGRPTIADVAVFVYVALAPMGGISLDPYPAVKAWVDRVKRLPRFIPINGLDNPLYRSRPSQ